jgi:hypothetical protein
MSRGAAGSARDAACRVPASMRSLSAVISCDQLWSAVSAAVGALSMAALRAMIRQSEILRRGLTSVLAYNLS